MNAEAPGKKDHGVSSVMCGCWGGSGEREIFVPITLHERQSSWACSRARTVLRSSGFSRRWRRARSLGLRVGGVSGVDDGDDIAVYV